MAHAVIYDTHKVVKKLVKAGFTEKQAEVFTEEQKELIDTHLATKQDLKNMENRITIRMGGMLMATVGLLASFIAILQYIK